MHTGAVDREAVLLELGLERAEPFPTACTSTRVDPGTDRVFTVRPAMGTLVSVVGLHSSGAAAEDAIEAAFGEMHRLIGILSRHDSSSAVAHLNGTGRLEDAPAELLRVVGCAHWYHRLTRGAFDITVKPLLDLFDGAWPEPTPAERAEVAELVGAEKLERHGRRLRLTRSGMAITLDGIAKGYIVDRMADALTARGMRRFLINAGGDIRASGGKEDGLPWMIGVRDPSSKQRGVLDVVPMIDGAVATSGNYEKEFRHIFEAFTGRSPDWSTSVSVMAKDAMAADALATALFAMEPASGLRLARSLPGCEFFLVDGDGRSARSPGFSSTAAKAGGS